MKHQVFIVGLSLAAMLGVVLVGCESDTGNQVSENNGSTLTTSPGQPIDQSMLLGKWDLDGERTNRANGQAGVTDIPSDISKDIMGTGWRFEQAGALRVDQTFGDKPGRWRMEGPNTLVVQPGMDSPEQRYQARFQDGFLYLTRNDGRILVFEKDKFFGL